MIEPWSPEVKETFREDHPVVMPVHQPRHNYARGDVRAYFDLIFGADHAEYKGLVSVAARDAASGEMCLIAAVPAAQIGDWAAMMHVSTRLDYYYGKAQHSGNATWGTERAFAYNAIHVDIDAHDPCVTVCGAKDTANRLIAMLPEAGYPTPNIVEYSGRGIHLVWYIEQVAATLGWMVRAVSVTYANAVQLLLHDLGINEYRVDMGYTQNIAGLTRIPGTFNTMARVYDTYEIFHRQRIDLPKVFDTVVVHTPPRARAGVVSVVGQRRVDALLQLCTLRPIQSGYRDLFCLHLFSACQMAGMENSAAMDIAIAANQSFRIPLKESEVVRYLSSATRKRYRFTTRRIISNLNISDD